ncbi:MAG TPA: cation:proton antiporter, partial [Gammaproteobacteria bacterium]|nr:cation:proton antiporter [Gammaproteobacteria bacterium]
MIELVNFVLLGLLAVTALAAIRLHDLFAVTMMFGIYSLLAAVVFVVLDAVDVAFTEAAVGVGISTILMLATIGLVGRQERRPSHRPLLPLAVVIVTGAALV